MRRITVIGMIILGLVALPLMAAAKSDNTPAKTQLCHMTGDGEAHVIEVSEKAEAAHVEHGDWVIDGDALAEACGIEVPEPSQVPDEDPVIPPAANFVDDVISCGNFLNPYCSIVLDASGSTGAIDTYIWRLSGPTTIDLEGPTHSLTKVLMGTYTVVLTVSGPDGTDIEERLLILTTP